VAASAATLFDAPEGRTGPAIDAVSARPDFVALLYPVITMTLPLAHGDSRKNLLGMSPLQELVERLSLEKQVRRDTPPVFLVHTSEDKSVPIEHSVLFFEALRRAGVPAELHLYERGAHGFGTRTDLGSTSGWVDRRVLPQSHRRGRSPRSVHSRGRRRLLHDVFVVRCLSRAGDLAFEL
jgi:acetyl esterase/lipase